MNDGWLPTLQEYSPGFTKDEWLKLLNNSEVIGPVWGGTLAAFYDAGGQATCSQIGLTFGKSPMSISGYCTNLAKRIHKLTGCPLSMRDKGKPRYWSILFQGQAADSRTPGSFVWRLRAELMDALGEFHIERFLWPKVESKLAGASIRIWKISEGKESTGLPDDIKSQLMERSRVAVHGSTKAITLRHEGLTLIIDAKFYKHSLASYMDKQMLHSANLYQIFTYVKNEDKTGSGKVSGLLLYAKTTEETEPFLSVNMGGNLMEVRSLDLNRSFREISASLDSIAASCLCCPCSPPAGISAM